MHKPCWRDFKLIVYSLLIVYIDYIVLIWLFASHPLNLWINYWINHNRFIQNDWFVKQLNKCWCLWVSHWFTNLTHLFKIIDSFINNTSNCLYEGIISHSQLIYLKHWFIMKSINNSESVKNSESIKSPNRLNESFKNTDSFINKRSNCLYEWEKHWFIKEQNTYLHEQVIE